MKFFLCICLQSGTTAVAAALHDREYIGIELKLEYFNEANKNINEIKKIISSKKRKLKKISS
jgi:DNA modification methylase